MSNEAKQMPDTFECESILVRDNNLIAQLEKDLTIARAEITRLQELVSAYAIELRTWEKTGEEFAEKQSTLLEERNDARREREEQRQRAEEAEEGSEPS